MSKYEGVPHVVIPTIRDEEHFMKFWKAWEEEFKGCVVHIVFDMDKLPSWIKDVETDITNFVYCWKDIDNDLGKNSWIIPRQTDCVRSYGYWKAWQHKPLFIVTLDDDVEPQDQHIQTFYNKLFTQEYPPHNFYNTLRWPCVPPRGTYYITEGCDVVHGGWTNVLDLSAEEQAKNYRLYEDSGSESFNMGLIPKGAYFSFCGMNAAWKPEMTKHMYFGLQGGEYPIDRCGDIWCGYHLTEVGAKVYTGYPLCKHTRASNLWSNMKKEKNAHLLSFQILHGGEEKLVPIWYNKKLVEARKIWESLFENE